VIDIHCIQKIKQDQIMSNNTSAMGRKAVLPLSGLVETPGIGTGWTESVSTSSGLPYCRLLLLFFVHYCNVLLSFL